VDKVWVWDEWPRCWRSDKGIDLVFEDYNEEVWVVQAKYYDEKYDVTKADIVSFLSESGRNGIFRRLLITPLDILMAVWSNGCIGWFPKEVELPKVLRVYSRGDVQ